MAYSPVVQIPDLGDEVFVACRAAFALFACSVPVVKRGASCYEQVRTLRAATVQNAVLRRENAQFSYFALVAVLY